MEQLNLFTTYEDRTIGTANHGVTDTNNLLAERGARYGKFIDQSRIAQTLKSVLRCEMGKAKWNYLMSDQKEALDMICHKLARIANGDPDYHDSWADIAGYAKLVSDRLETGKEV